MEGSLLMTAGLMGYPVSWLDALPEVLASIIPLSVLSPLKSCNLMLHHKYVCPTVMGNGLHSIEEAMALRVERNSYE